MKPKGENMAIQAALEAVNTEAGTLAVRAIAARIASEAPNLENLSPAQLEAIARAVVVDRLKDDLRGMADLARIDYQQERETFLAHAGRTGSGNTRRAYAAALARLEAFAAFHGVPVLALSPKEADDYAYSLMAERPAQAPEGRASASIRRDLAAVSSFFTFMERRHSTVRNPFRGTKARPAKTSKKAASYPDPKELARIMESLPPALRAAAAVMAYRGLRVGALPSLVIRGNRFTARSKGKDISGEMPAKAIRAIKDAQLDPKEPFAGWTETRLADQFRYQTEKLCKNGTIAAAYSVHDLRHLFAIQEYRKDRDLVRLRTLLSHASVQVTEVYLKGLGEL